MSVENLVERMVFLEAFIDDEEELSTKVGFNVRIEGRIVPKCKPYKCKCKPYSNISKKCSLCLNEKFIIICKKELCSLNRRNELASSCPHRNRYVLRNFRVT